MPAPAAPPPAAPARGPAPTKSAAAPSSAARGTPAPNPSGVRPNNPDAALARAAGQSVQIGARTPSPSRATTQTTPPAAAEPPKEVARAPGSVETNEFEAAFNELQSRAKPPGKPPEPVKEAPKPPVPATEEDPLGETDPLDQQAQEETPEVKPQDQEPRIDKEGKRRDPWRLVDSMRKQNRDLLRENAELRDVKNGELPPEWKSKWEVMEKRNTELENEIGFVNYRKSKEFITNYEQPFKQAWGEAWSALEGLQIAYRDGSTDPNTGQPVVKHGDMTMHDIQRLATMPPKEARIAIENMFPNPIHASEVTGHVGKIRNLVNAQNARLEEYQEKGGEWQRAQQEEASKVHRMTAETNQKLWKEANESFTERHDFLRPAEGDEAHNQALDKAVAFVEEAMAINIGDPKLTADERRTAVRKLVALKQRAIGYGVLSHRNRALKARVAELEKSLSDYQASAPGGGEGRAQDGNHVETDAFDMAMKDLERRGSRR